MNAANASALADTLSRERDRALLFRTLATLRSDLPLFEDVDQLRWTGPTTSFDEVAARLDAARTEKRRPSQGTDTQICHHHARLKAAYLQRKLAQSALYLRSVCLPNGALEA